MIKSKPRAPLTDIDVGPFSDISFLLIIFFILTTQIAAFKGSVVDIPSGTPPENPAEKKDEKKQLTVHLEGSFIRVGTDDEKSAPPIVSPEELKARLLAENFYAKEKMEDRFVILQTDDKASYDLYFKVVMMIDECGGFLCLMESADGKSGGDGGKG